MSGSYSVKPGKSSMGRQVDSRKKSSAGYSFGTCTRESLKMHSYITEEHAQRGQMEHKDTPAAVYENKSSLGKQTLKQNRTYPAYTVAHQKRFQDIPQYTPLQTPGPGAYE
ncbi:hypothetical protein CYMTET_43960 [Cymbomonas tetramitiformis]|uniref:Uncharacterized protein n=1 Tax=Cymbomonas tetramitiformis TaxID=36881 RepID=A0AAE0C2F5_9CHLO|nr:hypothetical protein CYMTET_43960 [Cymbomonas tetramitiformis]|eukprot:gene965-1482_t